MAKVAAPIPKTVLGRYAHLRTRQKGDPISPAHMEALCELIADYSLQLSRACAVIGLNPAVIRTATQGENPSHPEWVAMLERAEAEAEVNWLLELKQAGEDNRNAGIKAAEFMLRAINRKRYREMPEGGGAGITVQFIQRADPIEVAEFTIIESDEAPKGLSEGSNGDGAD